MGCFSYICRVCDKQIVSDFGQHDPVRLFLLKDGEVIEQMAGRYNSYGAVFTEEGEDLEWETMDWGDIVDLCFNDRESDGIAAIHTDCSETLVPTIQSKDDPNQGWLV